MKTTERERLILALLPLALVLGGYAWWFNMFKPLDVAQLEEARGKAAEEAVQPLEVMEQKAQVVMLEREIAELETESRTLDAEVAGASASLGGAARRMQAVEALTALFATHGLAIVEDCPADNRHKTQIPPCMSEATRRLSGSSAEKQGHLRCLHFRGRYMDVLAALEAIAADESLPVVPVGLTMEQADTGSDVRDWTLAVWM